MPSTSHSTICTSDLTKFPFDTHNCTVRFGSWVHSGEELDLQISKDALNTDDLIYNGEWDLIDTNVFKHPGIYKCCPNNTYPSINYSFKIQRISGAHTASVILPAFGITTAMSWFFSIIISFSFGHHHVSIFVGCPQQSSALEFMLRQHY